MVLLLFSDHSQLLPAAGGSRPARRVQLPHPHCGEASPRVRQPHILLPPCPSSAASPQPSQNDLQAPYELRGAVVGCANHGRSPSRVFMVLRLVLRSEGMGGFRNLRPLGFRRTEMSPGRAEQPHLWRSSLAGGSCPAWVLLPGGPTSPPLPTCLLVTQVPLLRCRKRDLAAPLGGRAPRVPAAAKLCSGAPRPSSVSPLPLPAPSAATWPRSSTTPSWTRSFAPC